MRESRLWEKEGEGSLSPTEDRRAQEMRREERQGAKMDRRREMAKRLGPVLLLVVVIAALVGVFAGDGFGEGDTSGVAEQRGGEKTGKALWREVVDVVSALAVIVIGVAMVWVMIQQQRQAKRQGVWERKFGESQLKQERELTERQEWLAKGESKQEVLRAVFEYVGKAAEGGAGAKESLDFVGQVVRKIGLFTEEENRLLAEIRDKGKELGSTTRTLLEEKKAGRAGWEIARRLQEKREELAAGLAGAAMKLGRTCWGGRAGEGYPDWRVVLSGERK